MLWNSVPFLDKSFSKAFAISEEDSVCPNAMSCSADTCFFIYLSNSKAGHSGKTMSSGVRKIKRHKLCKRLFTIFISLNFFPLTNEKQSHGSKCLLDSISMSKAPAL